MREKLIDLVEAVLVNKAGQCQFWPYSALRPCCEYTNQVHCDHHSLIRWAPGKWRSYGRDSGRGKRKDDEARDEEKMTASI